MTNLLLFRSDTPAKGLNTLLRGQKGQQRRYGKDETLGDLQTGLPWQAYHHLGKEHFGSFVETRRRNLAPPVISRNEGDKPGIVAPTRIVSRQVEERPNEGAQHPFQSRITLLAQPL